jgi:hypothetical protein
MRKDLFTNFKKRMLDIVIEARNAAISETVKVKRILPFACGGWWVLLFLWIMQDLLRIYHRILPRWMYYHIRISGFPL